ncbi:MAG: T9SS type A sorting domain-containing protein, partial [Bacteroidota bacterium]
GEYTQVIATDGYAIPVWADGRSNDGSVSIYAAWAPLSGPATALERSVRLQAKLQMISWYQEQNQVQISWQQANRGMTELRLYDLSGKLIGFAERFSSDNEAQRYSLDIKDTSKGFYIVEIRCDDAQMRQKILLH